MLTVFVNEMQKQDWNKTGTKQGKVTTKTTNGNKKKKVTCKPSLPHALIKCSENKNVRVCEIMRK